MIGDTFESMTGIGIVVAKFNSGITMKMKDEAVRAAEDNDANVEGVRKVPGAYDSPLAAREMASREDVDCVVVLGAIIKGDTDHDRVIASSTARSLQQVSLDTSTPVALGITGPGMTADEARDRIDYGYDAAESALEMAEAETPTGS